MAAIEIVNSAGQMERMYFRYPDFCLQLSRDAKDKLLWGVDRESAYRGPNTRPSLPPRPLPC